MIPRIKVLFFTTTFLLITAVDAFAQSDFRKGYIIKNNNDTIQALIAYKGNKANAKKCIYKLTANADNKIASPDQIKAFRFIDGKYFVSRHITSNGENTQVFLEYLINGIVSIYYYRDNIGEHYLVQNGGEYIELSNESKEIIVDGISYNRASKKYVGILKIVFKESPRISDKVNNLRLGHKSLIDIAEDFHNEVCNDEKCIIYEKELPTIKKHIGILIGANILSISENIHVDNPLAYLSNSQFGQNVFPSIGIYYRANMPYVNERLFFQYEATFHHVKLKTTNSYIESFFNYNYINQIDLVQSAFNNRFLLKYEVSKANVKPVIQFGGFANYLFKNDFNRYLEVRTPSDGLSSTARSTENPFSDFQFGIEAGIGLKTFLFKDKEISFDLRYSRGLAGRQNSNPGSILMHTIILNAGIQFSK